MNHDIFLTHFNNKTIIDYTSSMYKIQFDILLKTLIKIDIMSFAGVGDRANDII